MKIYLLNDTSSCHAGSVKVVNTLKYFMRKHEIIGTLNVAVSGEINYNFLRKCDAVVVNAEGSIHHNSPWGITLLKALGEAQSLNKKTYLLNSLYEKMDQRYDSIIQNVDFVCAREIYSYRNLKKINSGTALHPDYSIALPQTGLVIKKTKSLIKTKTHHSCIYPKVFNKIKATKLSIAKKKFEDYIETYKQAEVILTGQHHAVYAAALAGTPFIPTFSNSHKIESLIEWSRLPIRLCATKEQVIEDINKIKNNSEYKKNFLEFSNFILSKREPLEQYLTDIFN